MSRDVRVSDQDCYMCQINTAMMKKQVGKQFIFPIIVKRLGLGLGTWDLGPGTWDLGIEWRIENRE